jgi:lipopolysaccharide transport system ATP-binding protein
MPIIEVNHLTKEYHIGQTKSITHGFFRTFDRLCGKTVTRNPPFKALDNIDFTVEDGELIGIIGTNGAGKSTLLKILARVSVPTKGSIKVHGSVAPLIELGAGLHPELTGRENVYLNGAIMGIPIKIIRKKFNEIVKFAEIEEFIDTPIKRYSSGMAIRLGFSVASSVEPDILIIDEVLAVGDIAFQRKCFDRIEDLIKKRGKTVLLVSHNIRQVERICTRVILLDKGKIIADGRPSDVCNIFFQLSNKKIQSYLHEQYETKTNIQTSGEVEIRRIDILDVNGQPIDQIESSGMLRVSVCFDLKRFIKRPEIVVGTHTTDFVYLSASSTSVFDDRPDFEAGLHEVEYIVPSFPLVAGVYCIRVAFFDQNRRLMFAGETLKMFFVVSGNDETKEPGLRTLNFPTIWKLGNQTYSKHTSFSTSTEQIY